MASDPILKTEILVTEEPHVNKHLGSVIRVVDTETCIEYLLKVSDLMSLVRYGQITFGRVFAEFKVCTEKTSYDEYLVPLIALGESQRPKIWD